MEIEIAPWQEELFKPHRYKIIYGGRGSGKSYAVADALIFISLKKKSLIMCSREFQGSIKDSVHSLIVQRINNYKLNEFFEITYDEIRCKTSASKFIFKGFKNNIDNIKSIAGITHLWIEEADSLSIDSWTVIKPTIREAGSEIWATFNPKNANDLLYKEFILEGANEFQTQDAYVVKINYQDNPHFPQVLKDELERDKQKDFGKYLHIWEGELLKNSDSQVFKQDKHWQIDEFEEPIGIHPYYGLDFGFSQDPTAGIRCYVVNNILYITHEVYQHRLAIDEIGKKLNEKLKDYDSGRYTIWCDSASPDLIHLLNKHGYPAGGADKGKGSIEAGIEHLKTFDKIIIHARCIETAKEFCNYSYVVDRSGDITTKVKDDYNHCIDALRYALTRLMKSGIVSSYKTKLLNIDWV